MTLTSMPQRLLLPRRAPNWQDRGREPGTLVLAVLSRITRRLRDVAHVRGIPCADCWVSEMRARRPRYYAQGPWGTLAPDDLGGAK